MPLSPRKSSPEQPQEWRENEATAQAVGKVEGNQ